MNISLVQTGYYTNFFYDIRIFFFFLIFTILLARVSMYLNVPVRMFSRLNRMSFPV